MPRRRISRQKQVLREPAPVELRREVREDQPDLPCCDLLRQVDERIGRADVPVVLRDLVLEDQVVAERVPRQLGDEAMVLVQIGALVREDQVGRHVSLQLLEVLLHGDAGVREEAVAKALHDNPRRRISRQEILRAPPSLVSPIAVSAQHDPDDVGLRV